MALFGRKTPMISDKADGKANADPVIEPEDGADGKADGKTDGKTDGKVKDSLGTFRPVFWGGSSSGTVVTETTAMQQAAVYACVRVISEAIACLPLHVYKYDDIGARIAPEHPLNRLLYNLPNPEMTSFVLRETMMGHLLIYGNAYFQILRDGAGRVRALYPLLPGKMDVSRDPDTHEIYYTYWRDSDETRPQDKSGGVTLLPAAC